MEEAPRPVPPSERLDAIDALRGLALFGVMAINLVFEFRISIFEQFLLGQATTSPFDRAAESFLRVAVDMKAFSLFSMLFGLGLAIQFERLARDRRRIVLLLRRLIVLLAFGLAHLVLIWNGDILTEYALAGFVALPFLFGSRSILASAALLCFAFYVLVPPIVPLPDAAWMQQDVAGARLAYGDGGFSDVLAFRIRELVGILPLHFAVFPRTVGLILFGAFVWRTGIVQRATSNADILLVIAIIGFILGLGETLSSAGIARSVAPIVLALAYGAMIIGLMTTPAGRFLSWAAPLGRMAFTNYLAQSVIFSWFFYGYGLGLFDKLGAALALCLGTAVYVAQAIFSARWLKHYRFGPVEWLWRTLMYGVRQPM
jgi:uncharacterized protein